MAAALLAAAAATACESAESMSGDIDADELPELALVEEVRIGSIDDPELGFSNIYAVDVDDDGNVYVLERQEREIRVFARDGTRLRTIGRQGSGPGEFESPTAMGVIGDTLWVSDTRLRRVTLFTRAGELLLIVDGNGVPISTPGGFSVTVRPSRLRPGGLLESAMTGIPITPDMLGKSLIVPRLLFDLSGAIVDTIGVDTFPVPAMILSPDRITVGSITFSKPSPPSAEPWPISTADGRILVDRPHAETGDPTTFAITRMDIAGDTLYHNAFRYTPKSYEGAPFDSLVAARARPYEERAGADFEAVRAAIRDAYELPPFQSPVQSTHLGDDESVWLRREDTGGDHTWMLLAPDGSPRGQITIPRRATIRWSNGQEAWIVVPDEYDVQWLVRYRIE